MEADRHICINTTVSCVKGLVPVWLYFNGVKSLSSLCLSMTTEFLVRRGHIFYMINISFQQKAAYRDYSIVFMFSCSFINIDLSL